MRNLTRPVMLAIAVMGTLAGRADAGFVTTPPAGAFVETFNSLPQNLFTPSPIVLDGNTFTVDAVSGTFRVADYGILSDGVAIGTQDELGSISVTLGTPQSFVGADLSATGFSFSVFDANGGLLGTTTGTGSTSTPPTFIGFQADPGTAIGSVVFTDIDVNGGVLVLDNFTTAASAAAVPEPSSLVMCGIAGAFGLVVARVRRKRAV
jgi:hypothetical protein